MKKCLIKDQIDKKRFYIILMLGAKKMKRILLLFISSVFILLSMSIAVCELNKPLSDGMPTYEEFEARVKAFPYEATPERVAQIMAGIPKLKKCMNKKTIKELLGVPDYSRLSYGPKGPGEKWRGSSWTYYLSTRSNLVNIDDPCIQIFFNTFNQAHWIAPSNIKNAKEIGSPKDKCP
jgi:hypothetical protein